MKCHNVVDVGRLITFVCTGCKVLLVVWMTCLLISCFLVCCWMSFCFCFVFPRGEFIHQIRRDQHTTKTEKPYPLFATQVHKTFCLDITCLCMVVEGDLDSSTWTSIKSHFCSGREANKFARKQQKRNNTKKKNEPWRSWPRRWCG